MELNEMIKEYINSWKECVQCNHMCKDDLLVATNEDELICIDCIADGECYGQV